MNLIYLLLAVVVLAAVVFGGFHFLRGFDRGAGRALTYVNRNLERPPEESRRLQLPGRDHVCVFHAGSIFCAVCGRSERGE